MTAAVVLALFANAWAFLHPQPTSPRKEEPHGQGQDEP